MDPRKDSDVTSPLSRAQNWTTRLASGSITLVVDAIVLLAVVILMWSVWELGVDLYTGLREGRGAALNDLMVGVLTVLIFIEVFELSIKYLNTRTVLIKDLYEVSIAVILREVWVGMFAHTIKWEMVLAVAFLLLAIGLLRFAEVHYGTSRTLGKSKE